MGTDEMKQVGAWILEVLRAAEDESVGQKVRAEIASFCADFPVPGIA
jgi:glycine hydroxymethyltransferase